jgi:hypothetical protein
MSEALVARLRTVASGMGGFNAVTEAADRIEALERELLAAREDARRYAWLRDACLQQPNKSRAVKVHEFVGQPIAYGDTIDAAIDSAMKGDGHG